MLYLLMFDEFLGAYAKACAAAIAFAKAMAIKKAKATRGQRQRVVCAVAGALWRIGDNLRSTQYIF